MYSRMRVHTHALNFLRSGCLPHLTHQVNHSKTSSHGSVGFSSLSDAEDALKALNGKKHDGCVLHVSLADSSAGGSGAGGSNQVGFRRCVCVCEPNAHSWRPEPMLLMLPPHCCSLRTGPPCHRLRQPLRWVHGRVGMGALVSFWHSGAEACACHSQALPHTLCS